jgi:hypothetical protein
MTTGINVISALQVYKGAHCATLTYGCTAWFEPSDEPEYVETDTNDACQHYDSSADDSDQVPALHPPQSYPSDAVPTKTK